MFNSETLAKARAEAARLNGLLRELHLEEERCQLQRGRLEKEKSTVQALIDVCDLAQRLANRPDSVLGVTLTPVFPDRSNGPQFVGLSKPAPGSIAERRAATANSTPLDSAVPHKRKPDGLPTIAQMVLAVLEGEDEGMRPRDVLEFIRRKWWSDAQYTVVCSALCRGVADGELHRDGGRYKLNGVARE